MRVRTDGRHAQVGASRLQSSQASVLGAQHSGSSGSRCQSSANGLRSPTAAAVAVAAVAGPGCICSTRSPAEPCPPADRPCLLGRRPASSRHLCCRLHGCLQPPAGPGPCARHCLRQHATRPQRQQLCPPVPPARPLPPPTQRGLPVPPHESHQSGGPLQWLESTPLDCRSSPGVTSQNSSSAALSSHEREDRASNAAEMQECLCNLNLDYRSDLFLQPHPLAHLHGCCNPHWLAVTKKKNSCPRSRGPTGLHPERLVLHRST